MNQFVVSKIASKMFKAIEETTQKRVDTFLSQPSDGQTGRTHVLRNIFFEEGKLHRSADTFLRKLDKYTQE